MSLPKHNPAIRRVFITGRIPAAGLDLLRQKFQVEQYEGPLPVPRRQLIQKARCCEALVTLVSDRIDREVLQASHSLKLISNHAVGVDNIDVAFATRQGILVCNTPAVLSEATADLTWALILAVCRRVVEGDRLVRAGAFRAWDPLLLRGQDLVGKTLGIVGAGRIGSAVARRALGWQMSVIYFNHSPRPELEACVSARRVDLEDLFRQADVVSLHLPLTHETHHLISAPLLRQMKPTAVFINTARGAIVNEAHLARALEEGWIAGAGLDVFEHEPNIHPELLKQPNVVLTPHIGSATYTTRDAMAEMAARNILLFSEGKKPLSVVNPAVLARFGIRD